MLWWNLTILGHLHTQRCSSSDEYVTIFYIFKYNLWDLWCWFLQIPPGYSHSMFLMGMFYIYMNCLLARSVPILTKNRTVFIRPGLQLISLNDAVKDAIVNIPNEAYSPGHQKDQLLTMEGMIITIQNCHPQRPVLTSSLSSRDRE